MGVTVSLPLFGHPGRELEEVKRVRGQDLRKLGVSLGERLARAADILDRLEADGWVTHLGAYDVLFTRPGVATQEEASKRIGALGVDVEQLLIIEDVEDEE
jgi:hypothetical protein